MVNSASGAAPAFPGEVKICLPNALKHKKCTFGADRCYHVHLPYADLPDNLRGAVNSYIAKYDNLALANGVTEIPYRIPKKGPKKRKSAKKVKVQEESSESSSSALFESSSSDSE